MLSIMLYILKYMIFQWTNECWFVLWITMQINGVWVRMIIGICEKTMYFVFCMHLHVYEDHS